MIKVLFSTLVYFLLMSPLLAQKTSKPFYGTYGDYSTRLTLKPDSTFELIETDPIFPYTFENFTSNVVWKLQEDTVVLNPHLEKRLPKVTVLEKSVKKIMIPFQ